VFAWTLSHRDVQQARTLAFATLVFGHVVMSFAFRSRNKVLWEIGALGNLRLVVVVAVSAALQAGILLTSSGRRLFQLADLPIQTVGVAALWGLVPVSLLELVKLIRRVGRQRG
jgi:P-type Ca2+ transporter type 2C